MKKLVALFMIFLFPMIADAEKIITLKEVNIAGQTVKLGQGADIVQSRISAEKYVPFSSYGKDSKGYYKDRGISYIITYGFPKGSKEGGYVVKEIEKIEPDASSKKSSSTSESLTREQVLQLRKKYSISVISFDSETRHGTEFPYSDKVSLRITNNSDVQLPYLTVLTKRYNSKGKMIGSSRTSIPGEKIKPGESTFIDYYPRGQMPGVNKITAEVEKSISPSEFKFIKELPN